MSRAPGGRVGLAASRIVTPDQLLEPGVVWLDLANGTIDEVAEGRPAPDRQGSLLDLGESTLAPGFVDVHVHGGAGAEVNGEDPGSVADCVASMARFLASHGTTSFLATTVADRPERLVATVAGIARAAAADTDGARVLGTHLEGPFLAPTRAGAQDPTALRPPDERELATLLEAGGGTVRIVTIAPELPGAEGLLRRALATGAVVALGHSDADYETARRAFDAGASHATHLFNAMAPLHHRRPGLVAAALLDETATVELVCDLVHVHPAVIELAARLVGERLVAVSDAMAASGLGGGGHTFGRRGVFVEGDRVSLEADDTILAGSVLTMEKAVHNLRTATGLSLGTCIAAATYSPVRSMLGKATQRPLPSAAFGAASGLGRLIGGGPADLVVLSPDLTVEATMVRGAVVYDPEGVLRRD